MFAHLGFQMILEADQQCILFHSENRVHSQEGDRARTQCQRMQKQRHKGEIDVAGGGGALNVSVTFRMLTEKSYKWPKKILMID